MATHPYYVGKKVNYTEINRVEQFIDQKLGTMEKKADEVEQYDFTYAPCQLSTSEMEILQQRYLDQHWTSVSINCQHAPNMPSSLPYKVMVTLVFDNREK